MNRLQFLQQLRAETERFLQRLDVCISDEKHMEKQKAEGARWGNADQKEMHRAATKRASMDLTRELAKLRKLPS